MPAINWKEINKRILVIGRFSETPKDGFAIGKKLTKGFIEEICPGYFREYDPKACAFVDGSYFGGYTFTVPSQSTVGEFVPIKDESALMRISSGNTGRASARI